MLLRSNRHVVSKSTKWVTRRCLGVCCCVLISRSIFGQVETTRGHYFAHDTVEDRYGVIAPWYKGQNGQFDLRVRIAVETMKRYPWTTSDTAVAVVPQYVLNGTWRITPDGTITIPPLSNWNNNDLAQMAAREMDAFISYYRYSGDAAALARLSLSANTLLDHCVTSSENSWPHILISVPATGKPYGNCAADGWIQLDIVGETGIALIHGYEVTGEKRWLLAAEHWANLLAQKRNRQPGEPPWGRYANPQDVNWGMDESGNVQAGGIVYVLTLLDDLIRLGYTGPDNSLMQTRDAAQAYLRDALLPNWTVNETWGRNYQDGPDPVQAQTTTDRTVRYLLANKNYFTNWKNDVRNILSLYLNHTSVSPASAGGPYSGAWALPESSLCCSTSLAWAPVELASNFAQYANDTQSEWAKEIARRQLILGTYDFRLNGMVEDNILGGTIEAGGWFIAAHPSALEWTLQAMSWMPELTGAGREDHIMRTTSVVSDVDYQPGKIAYSTFDAPGETQEVVRLAFKPESITAEGQALRLRNNLNVNGYSEKPLSNGDYIVEIRHDGLKHILIQGADPAVAVPGHQLRYEGAWTISRGDVPHPRVATAAAASASYSFEGSQVRVFGEVSPEGGLADVFLDDVQQLAGIDFWNPRALHHQVVYYNNGLANGNHVLKVVARGAGNPISKGHAVNIDDLSYSAATGGSSIGEGQGPTDTQRLIFGYTGRTDYIDMDGNAWRPGTEFVARTGARTDSVARTWWTTRQAIFVTNTRSPELYRYGVHWPEFVANFTVGPGVYHVTIHLAETQMTGPHQRSMTILVNDEIKADELDPFGAAGGANRALDLVYDGITPKNGMIAVRFKGNPGAGCNSEAIVQAIEVGPGPGGNGNNGPQITGYE
jgi:Malectin domain